jgi:tRNA pseudouridine55 synthase
MTSPSGMFLVDKPAGPSSFGVLRALRPVLGSKTGHAGTLDPFAEGLLLVVSGRATRLARFLVGMDKRYHAVIQLGARSSTLDPEGEIEPSGASTDANSVSQAAAALIGDVLQSVPAASAVKIDGQRSYARMRRGETATAPPRTVHIDRIEITAFDADLQRAEVDVTCSKGTYVRQIAADIGEATGAGAYCLTLRRHAVGPWSAEDAGTIDQITAEPLGRWFRTPFEALAHLPAHQLSAPELERVEHGRMIDEPPGESGEIVRLAREGTLVAVAEAREGMLYPVVVLA